MKCGKTKQQQLRDLYTSVRNLGNKMEELGLLVQEVKPDLVENNRNGWNRPEWSTGIEGVSAQEREK